jgi:CrcB protein
VKAFARILARARHPGPGEPIDPDLVAERPSAPQAWQRPEIILAVAAGGLIGAPARYELGVALPSQPGAFPLATFLINATGSLALGVIVTLIVERWPPTEYLRPFVATGVLGAYTTWSTFMVDADNLFRNGHAAVAIGYLAASLAAGLGGAYLGILSARTRWSRLWRRSEDGGSP